MNLVIDTSAILAVLLNETSKSVIVEQTKGYNLLAPSSLDAEIGNALSAMFKRGRLTLEEAITVIEQFSEIPIRRTPIRLVESLKLAESSEIYAYDAYMIDCASKYRCPILSLDQKMIQVAKDLDITVMEVSS